MNLAQALIQVAAFRCWSSSGLTGDPRADSVGGFVDLIQRRSPKISVYQGRGEGVAGADGVGDFHSEAGMLRALVSGNKQAAVCGASNASQLQIVGREQAARRILFSEMFQFQQAHDPGKFFMIEFDDGCQLHRFRHHARVKEFLPEIDVANPHRTWLSGKEKPAHGGTTVL
jgi:hypothetical protein